MSTIEKAMEKMGGGPAAPEQPAATGQNREQAVATATTETVAREDSSTVAAQTAATETRTLEEYTRKSVTLDWHRLGKEGVINPHQGKHSQISDQLRNIKRPLLLHAEGKGASIVNHPNLIMVTSSLPGEGKTFTSINLAMSMAMEMDKKILLIDADVAKPEVSTRLGVKAEKGFTDVLSDSAVGMRDVLIKTDVPNLMLMSAGHRHPRATELLASEAMRKLADEIATRYADRVVIFDSPPLLMTTEARVLAELMGQIVVVVEESRTPQPVVKEALSLLKSCEIVGLVMNKSKRPTGTEYYGGYGYGYGYGYGQ